MLSGAMSPTALCFTLPNDANYLPSDIDGPTPPTDGTPGYFLNFETTGSLRLYQLSPDFTAGTATLTQVSPDISVAPFTEACNGGVCITPAHPPFLLTSCTCIVAFAVRAAPAHLSA